MKLIIADDHILLGQAVAANLMRLENYDVTVVTSLPTLLSSLGENEFDIIMLDIKMPGMNGLTSVRQVCEACKEGKVVLFTGQVDSRFVADSLALGVSGHIPKDLPLRSLDSALQLIASGQAFLPVAPRTDETGSHLSSRELLILRLASDGMTNKEIARDTASSEVAIKMHMRNICRKLNARNRAHAAIIAKELLLI